VKRWTGAEVEVAVRGDLTAGQAAARLDRSETAVRRIRAQVRDGDRRLLGLLAREMWP
jgi:hypothetical protein